MSKWERAVLGQIATVVSGSTPRTSDANSWNGNNYWITPAEIEDSTTIVTNTKRKITDKAVKDTNLTLLPAGTVLLSSRAPIGKVAIAGVDMYCNQGFKNLICSDRVYNKYLFWFLKGKTQFLKSRGRGSTFKELSKRLVEEVEIPLPPLETQHKIAQLLDTVSEILAMRKQQLAELGNLTKSIFYDMFGDPAINQKGWEMVTWRDVIEIKNGRNQKAVEEDNGIYPIYGSGGVIGYAKEYLCAENTVIIGRKGNINRPIFVKEKFWNVDTAFGLIARKTTLMPTYLYYFCLGYDFEKLSTTVTIPSLTKANLLNVSMPLPPLKLQESFAKIVFAIEAQKEIVRQAADESQYLFETLMSKYFD